MTNGRNNHGCGWVWTSNGLEIIVAGGWERIDSEIYTFQTDTWRAGTDLPVVSGPIAPLNSWEQNKK